MAAELTAAVDALDHGIYLSLLWQHLTGIKSVLTLFCDSRCVVDTVNVRSKTLPKDRTLTLMVAHLRELVEQYSVTVVYVPTGDNVADSFTKIKPTEKLW